MIRAFEQRDIPEVARLRSRCFERSVWSSEEELAHALERVFLRNPWRATTTFPAGFVALDAARAVTGFVGLVPRPLYHCGREQKALLWSQLMVDPSCRGGGLGARLLSACMDLPADLLFADSLTAAALSIWLGLGGSSVPATRLAWVLPLTPLSGTAASPGLLLRIARRAAAFLPGEHRHPPADGSVQPIDFRAAAGLMSAPNDILHGTYAPSELSWLYDCLGERYGGALSGAAIYHDERLAGWFLYVMRGARAVVLHFSAGDAVRELVFRHLLHHARSSGARLATARFGLVPTDVLRTGRGRLEFQGNGVAMHIRDPDLRRAVLEDRAQLSGLDGEWWLPL